MFELEVLQSSLSEKDTATISYFGFANKSIQINGLIENERLSIIELQASEIEYFHVESQRIKWQKFKYGVRRFFSKKH